MSLLKQLVDQIVDESIDVLDNVLKVEGYLVENAQVRAKVDALFTKENLSRIAGSQAERLSMYQTYVGHSMFQILASSPSLPALMDEWEDEIRTNNSRRVLGQLTTILADAKFTEQQARDYYGWYVAGKPDTKKAREAMDSVIKARAERLAATSNDPKTVHA